ncbi:MAG TPA: tripartite tricarboxylate transporter TctB family protein [Bacillota bacterium]|nr:tripartite tricarboxylate transporter TctB family protein [Bacillota bacterium]HOH09698.1 tripartite tricarboxylate transporter TctB family protein [Bacillota bacterium]HOS49804.1 tripartite tricarboxylate transporter TctB family protein [Bacillota bacterium]HOY89045.1 tripartite tricarboxylate transporter TctB family protein [Bacillota bacterium]HPI00585.1 tripartite tricarboxylate transporter TctB family protein [Bacillota bacterium]
MSIAYFAKGAGLAIMLAAFAMAVGLAYIVASRTAKRRMAGLVALGASFISLGAFVLVLSANLETSVFNGNEAAMIPRLWAGILIPASVLMIYRALTGAEEEPEPAGRTDKVLAVLAALTISVALMDYLGYFICSAAFILICMYMLGYRKFPVMLLISGSWVAFSYFVFYRLLYVGLPLGSIIKAVFGI